MRIWLVTVGEPWPTDGDHPRLHRTGINAGFLASRGHEVTSWSGTFDHASKTERTGRDTDSTTEQGYRLIGICAGTYERNVSLKRIKYHREVTRRFREMVKTEPTPDIIVVSLTPLELARAAVEYGSQHNIPVVVDVRDMWPDIWAEQLPGPAQALKGLIFAPFYNDLKIAIRGATAVIGITDAAVDWALVHAGRCRGPLETGFPLAYVTNRPAEDKIEAALQYWRSLGVGASGEIVGCFFGTFTTRVDVDTPLRAVVDMPEAMCSRVKLVFCGRGENEDLIRGYAAKSSQIICHEWVHSPEIVALMRLSSFGVLPYPPTLDFIRSLPNKVFEYLSAGLPIISSLRGEIEGLFAQFNCGALYETKNPNSFANILSSALDRPDMLVKMSEGAKAAGACYDPISICTRFETFLEKVVRETKRAA